MKKFQTKLKSIYYAIVQFFKRRKFAEFDKKLEKAISDREVDRIILKDKIIKATRKYLKLDANSEYIPKDIKNKEEIRQKVLADYGQEMSKLDMYLNRNLRICDL